VEVHEVLEQVVQVPRRGRHVEHRVPAAAAGAFLQGLVQLRYAFQRFAGAGVVQERQLRRGLPVGDGALQHGVVDVGDDPEAGVGTDLHYRLCGGQGAVGEGYRRVLPKRVGGGGRAGGGLEWERRGVVALVVADRIHRCAAEVRPQAHTRDLVALETAVGVEQVVPPGVVVLRSAQRLLGEYAAEQLGAAFVGVAA